MIVEMLQVLEEVAVVVSESCRYVRAQNHERGTSRKGLANLC